MPMVIGGDSVSLQPLVSILMVVCGENTGISRRIGPGERSGIGINRKFWLGFFWVMLFTLTFS